MPIKKAKEKAKGGRGIINEKMKARQIQKGEVRNPKGRPKKGSAIADIINSTGDLKAPESLTSKIRDLLKLPKGKK